MEVEELFCADTVVVVRFAAFQAQNSVDDFDKSKGPSDAGAFSSVEPRPLDGSSWMSSDCLLQSVGTWMGWYLTHGSQGQTPVTTPTFLPLSHFWGVCSDQ